MPEDYILGFTLLSLVYNSVRRNLWLNRMVKCSNCGEEIVGEPINRLKYKWSSRIPDRLYFCKYCYLECDDFDRGTSPTTVGFTTAITVFVILLIIWLVKLAH